MHSRFTILLALLLVFDSAQSQSSWHINRLTIAEGLSEGYIYAIHQDKKGFIWIGTHGGLNRYDGYGFKVFQYQPFNSASLGDNGIFFIKEDSTTGKFWIGGSSCLNEFDPDRFTNTRYSYNNQQLEFSDGIFVNNHEMLLACEYGVLLFNTKTKNFTKVQVFDEHNNQATITRVENTCSDRKGNYMIMSKTGVFFFDPETRTCRRKTRSSPDLSAFYNYEVFNVVEDHLGNYWIATNKKGMIRYDPVSKTMSTLPLPTPLQNESLRFDVVMEDSQNNIWAGSTNGLFKINPETLSSEYFSSDKRNPVFLSHSEINVITEDRNHFMWVGTVGGGINKMIPQKSGFKNVLIARDDGGKKTGTYIMALQQKDSNMWFTNIWDEVGKVNIKTGQVTVIRKPALPSHYTWYTEGSIVKNTNNDPVILNGENSYEVVEKKPGNVSIVTRSSPGLSHIFSSKNHHTYYLMRATVSKTYCQNDTFYGNQFFYNTIDDNAGNIWIGTSKGLIKFTPNTNQIVQFMHDDKNNKSISSDFIYALEIDNDYQNIWMATYHGGLCSYNIANGTFRHYDKDDGLADNIVYALEKDDHGNLWFSTNAGISSYNVTTKTFHNYSKSDGLLNDEFNRRSSYKNENGWIFFGGIFGIDYFHPDSIENDNTIPVLAFTGFRVFNNDRLPDNKKPFPQIELNHSDSYISIDFAALDYNDQQKIQYAYRLNNDTQWIKLGRQHNLSFANWEAGHHYLHICSFNVEGTRVNNEITCLVIIHPPWWQTWWFRILAAAMILGITVLAIRIYLRNKLQKQRSLLEKEQAIEKERTRIATDMHDDLGAGLSRIKFLSEAIRIKKGDDLAIQPEIGKISSYSHEMIEKMGEIVWALNEKNDTLADLLAFARSYAVDYLQNHGIDCKVEAPEEFPQFYINGETRRNVFLSVKECLFNIVKHADASEVKIKFTVDHELKISISDNGKGIDWEKIRPYSNGLPNIQKRMEALKGKVEYINKNGTTVMMKIPV